MPAVFALDIPDPKTWLIVFGALIVLVLASKAGVFGSSSGNVQGRGRMYRCARCGRDFQPEKVELLDNGNVRQWVDDRCPNCGWDKDYRDHNNDGVPDHMQHGGSSGGW